MVNLAAIDTDFRLIGPVPIEVWRSELLRVNSPLMTYVEAMHDVAGAHSALCLAQAWLENKYATTGIIIKPTDWNPLSLRPWDNDPKGMPEGATGVIVASDGGKFLRFSAPQYCVKEWRRRIVDDPGYKGGVYTKTTSLKSMLGVYAPSGDVHPVTGKDNADIGYASTVTTMLNKYAAMTASTPAPQPVPTSSNGKGNATMTFARYRPPGLNRDLWLPSHLDVETKIITSSRFRSYQKFTAQSKTTVHDTGNPKTTAAGEYEWAAGGRVGGSVGGYNAITDASRIIFTAPFDELTWHAGTPVGNQSWGVEMAFGGGQNFDMVLDTNAALHGAICAAMNWDVYAAAVLHQAWYGKWCAAQILNRKIWPQRQKAMADAADAARLAAGGVITPAPVLTAYAKPYLIPALEEALAKAATPDEPARTVAPRSVYDPQSKTRFFWVGDRVRTIQDTEREQYAYIGSPDVGAPIPKGKEFDVNWLFVTADGKEWYLTPWGARIFAEHTERISDIKTDELRAA